MQTIQNYCKRIQFICKLRIFFIILIYLVTTLSAPEICHVFP